ncbi:hypothetical protein CL629_04710 [bacterium]|nr:hypothetical protein [bacterium]|tara:strand:+ start:10989 stop:11531 length:543 start_codon:yes stop_codon:yes gene_type:complete
MTPRQKITLIVSVVVVLALVIVGSLARRGEEAEPEPEIGNGTEKVVLQDEKNIDAPEVIEKEKIFTPEIPKFVTPTKPKKESPANEKMGISFGLYEIKVDKNGFTPNSIAVNKGDIIDLKIQAVDDDYDFVILYYGAYILIEKGTTGTLSFGATDTGTIMFTCRDLCPNEGKKGEFIVIP